MRFTIFLFTLLIALNSKAQIVEIPDGNFKQLLIEKGVDTNGDLEIQLTEAEAIESLLVDDGNISSIEGIKSFKNLVQLDIQFLNLYLNSVDLSDLVFLEVVKFNFNNTYENLDLSGCTSLLEVQAFDVVNLILTNCSSLERIVLHMYETIELSGCENLSYFELAVYEYLDFSLLDLTALDSLNIFGINGSELNIVNLPNLKYLKATDPGLIFIRECPKLERIVVDNFVRSFDIADLQNLKNISIDNIDAEGYLYIENCPTLESVNIEVVDFANTISVINCPELEIFNFSQYADLDHLIINNCGSIVDLNLTTATQPNSVDLTGLSSLKSLFFNAAPTELNLDGCYSLEDYGYVFSTTEVLDFSDCINLKEINLHSSFYLKTLILQNGNFEAYSLSDIQVLSHVCVDPDEIVAMTSYLSTFEDVDVEVTASCDFADGGKPFSVTGTSYLDINNDSCKTSTQTLPFSKYVINDGIGDRIFYTNEEGNYQYKLIEGQYSFGPELTLGDHIFTAYPEAQNANFPTEGSSINQDFCLIPSAEEVIIIDVNMIPLEPARPGFDAKYQITYTNTGNVTREGEIGLNYQVEYMNFTMPKPMYSIYDEGYIAWNFEDLVPFESRTIEFTMQLNSPMDIPALNGGEELLFVADARPVENQMSSVFRSYLYQEVVNSFDPNDKTCLNGNSYDSQQHGDYLKYMIRFENTGTAEAINIVVTDTLDATKFDLQTLQVINSSHDVKTELTDNVVKFTFKDINLPFVDQFNDGYLTFKIKPFSNLTLGDDIRNKAEIYFDFNFPIVTNSTSTIVSSLSSTNKLEANSFDLKIFPNPASEYLSLSSDELMNRIELIDLSGRLIQSVSFIEAKSQHNHFVNRLMPGVYLIKAYSKNGVSVKKIVIE